jgi:hypothetical protein
MTQITDSAAFTGATERRLPRMIAGSLAFFRNATPVHVPPLPMPGPQAEALIDAEHARLSSFGSWDALRDDLRARAASTGRKSA